MFNGGQKKPTVHDDGLGDKVDEIVVLQLIAK